MMKHIKLFESFLNENLQDVKIKDQFIATNDKPKFYFLRNGRNERSLVKGDIIKITKLNADNKPDNYVALVIKSDIGNIDSILIKMDDLKNNFDKI